MKMSRITVDSHIRVPNANMNSKSWEFHTAVSILSADVKSTHSVYLIFSKVCMLSGFCHLAFCPTILNPRSHNK